jgi:signal transduction histidine kinase
MMGVNYLTKRLGSSNDDNVAQVLKELREAIERADSITRNLLDFAGSQTLSTKAEDLNKILEETLRLVRHDLAQKDVQVVKQLGERLPCVAVDKRQIQQVFVNLFLNALHALRSHGTLTLRTYARQMTETSHFEGSRKATHLWVGDIAVITEVEDNGTGIPQEHLTRIFDPFFTTKPTGQGAGLGLAISKKIIELHGGSLDVSNLPAGGVRVTVKLKAEKG